MRALVLSGGGAKGAYQVGVLKRWLLEEGLEYDILCGVSVGAINVAQLSQAAMGKISESYSKLMMTWSNLTSSSIYRNWPCGKISAFWKNSIVDSSPLMNMLKLSIDHKKIRSSGRKVRVGAVCLETGEYRTGTELNDDIVDWVVASSSFPVFFTPVKIDGKLWIDGGLRSVTPLDEALALGASYIDVIMCSNPNQNLLHKMIHSAVPDVAYRSAEIMLDQIMRADVRAIGLKNRLLDAGTASYEKINIRLIQPNKPLECDSLDFDPPKIKKMIKQGYDDAVCCSCEKNVI